MKTTVDIPQSLLDEAKKLAANHRTSVKALIEEGLRRVISEHQRSGVFRLRKATFKGQGLHPEMEGTSWERVRERAYEGRGG
ncbi:MAG: type II toxin-antitoxin system VapB family antitoxin [Nitrospirota bacterium]|nr:type II toxin-antitoxin system VapB family antitoxin [Nitrospirota bacterium]MDH5588242.1 type II toxin-antitoxin system VapB family antitoxin [Nitrospirota bacterium]